MNLNPLSKIQLSGFKSIRDCSLELTELNVLIGANGAGKSNFLGFFRLMKQLLDGHLKLYVAKQGGPDALLYFGRKKTQSMQAQLYFGNNGYKFSLEPTLDNHMVFASEALWWNVSGERPLGSGHFETEVESQKGLTEIYSYTVPVMRSWRLYHFHDTGESALMKQVHNIKDHAYLREDAANLAAFLYFLRENHAAHYQKIVKTIQLVAPFFGDFILRPKVDNAEKIELQWCEMGEDIPFSAAYLSDGSLRFICLATVLLQPKELQPKTILIDEPELGLHPFAIRLLGGMLRSAAKNMQIILSTQSVPLVNEFEIDNLIVVEREQGATTFKRLQADAFSNWLEDYSLGELWEKNVLGGRPRK